MRGDNPRYRLTTVGLIGESADCPHAGADGPQAVWPDRRKDGNGDSGSGCGPHLRRHPHRGAQAAGAGDAPEVQNADRAGVLRLLWWHPRAGQSVHYRGIADQGLPRERHDRQEWIPPRGNPGPDRSRVLDRRSGKGGHVAARLPTTPDMVAGALTALLEGRPFTLSTKSVCDECPTIREKKATSTLPRRRQSVTFTPGAPLNQMRCF